MAGVKFRTVKRRRRAGSQRGAYEFVSLLGLEEVDPLEIVRKIGEGLEFQSVVRFQEITDFSTADVADLMSIPPRTLQRRKAEGRLEPEESDRLLRVARVFAKAVELFEGDGPAAQHWLRTPVVALGGERPIALARTDVGSREVEALIDRLEHGVLT